MGRAAAQVPSRGRRRGGGGGGHGVVATAASSTPSVKRATSSSSSSRNLRLLPPPPPPRQTRATKNDSQQSARSQVVPAGMQDTPALQSTTEAPTEAPPPHAAPISPSTAASSSSSSTAGSSPPTPGRGRRTRLSDPLKQEERPCEETVTSEAPIKVADSASSPSSSSTLAVVVPTRPSSGGPDPVVNNVTSATGVVNLTGARKRKAHRVVKRETCEESPVSTSQQQPAATNEVHPDGVAPASSSEQGHSSSEESAAPSSTPEEGARLVCPVCDCSEFSSQHDFTVHIRSHNEATGSAGASGSTSPPSSSGSSTSNNNKVFSCSICGKLLSSSSSLDRHMLVHSGERPFKCRICSVAFTTNGNMHRHMRTHNNNTSSVNNNHQHSLDSDGGSSDSAASDSNKPLNNRKRRSNGDLNVPSPKKRSEEGPAATSPPAGAVPPHVSCHGRCDKCFMTFNSERDLSLHRYAAHAPHDDELAMDDPKKSSEPQIGFKDLTFVDFSTEKFPLIARTVCERSVHKASSVLHRFQCEECGRAFPCGSALNMHVTSAHAEVSPRDLTCPRRKLHYEEKHDFFAGLDLQTKSPSSSPPPAVTTTPSPIKVRDISELAMPRQEEELFLDIKSSEQLATRDLADIPSILSMANRGALDLAKSPNSTSDESLRQMKLRGEFPCRLCTAVFPNLRALKGHNRVHLSTGAPYLCNMCEYSSNDKATLVRHLRTHNGDRPFECLLCHYAFTTKANCERHLRNRHHKMSREEVRRSIACHLGEEISPERPHECAACDRSFPTRTAALSHVAREHPLQNAADLVRLGADPEEIEDEEELMMSPGTSPRPREDYERSSSRCSSTEEVTEPVKRASVPSPLDLSMDALDLSKKPSPAVAPLPITVPVVKPVAPPLRPPPPPPQDAPQDLTKPKEAPVKITPPLVSHPHIPHIPHPFLTHHSIPPSPSAYFANPLSMYLGSPFQRPPFPFYMPHIFGNGPSQAATPPPPPPAIPTTSSALENVKEQLQKELIRGLQLTSGGSIVMDALRKNQAPAPEPSPKSPAVIPQQQQQPPLPPPPSEPRPEPPVKMVIKNGVLMPKQKQRRYRTERPFACEHCSARFTLRSNMERHVKQQHPQFWSQRPRGGRRPAASSSSSQVSRREAREPSPLPPSHQPDLTILSESRISDEVRVKMALAHQLKQKNLSGGNKERRRQAEREESATEGDGEYEEDESDLIIDEAPSSRLQRHQGTTAPREPADADLASVSRLLVNASASAQSLQQYFQGAEEDEEEEEGFMEGDELDEGMLDCEDGSSSEQQTSGDEGRSQANRPTSPSREKRKSAYSSAPNRVSCPYCFRKFPWSSSLRRHILTHTGQKPFKCAHCPLLFTTKSNCDRHLLRKHSKKGASPPTSAPTTPIPPPPPPPPTEDSYLMRNVPERPFKCNLCPSSTFSTERNLRKHMSSKHAGSKRHSTSPPTPSSSTASTTTPPSSGKDTVSTGDSGRAASPDPLPPTSDSSTSPEQVTLVVPTLAPPGPGLTCYKCNQTFSSEARLSAHLESHSDLPFKCHLCENSYAERHEALEHIRNMHAAEYELLVSKGALDPNAEDCTVNAPPSSLNNNNNNEGGDETLETLRGKFPDYANRKVMCAFCMRRFWSAEDLRRHMRTHTGERPFTCDICWRKFTLKHSMLRHRKKHAVGGGLGVFGPASVASSLSTDPAMSDDDAHSVESSERGVHAAASSVTREGLRRWAEGHLAVYSGTATAGRLAGLRSDQPGEDDLIGNLLGIKDRAIIDHMLSKPADAAAKLLGVSSQR